MEIIKGRQRKPPRIVVYGQEGIGKSSFGASAPSPIFIPIEEGSLHLNVARFPRIRSWGDMIDALRQFNDSLRDQLSTTQRHRALSRSTNVLSNLLGDVDAWAMAWWLEDTKWYAR